MLLPIMKIGKKNINISYSINQLNIIMGSENDNNIINKDLLYKRKIDS